MTVAPTSAFNPTVAAMITDAYWQVGAISEDEQPTADLMAKGLQIANYLVKEWEANADYHVWTEEEAILFLQPLQYRYQLGGPTTDHACPAFGFTLGSLSNPAASGATTITPVSTSGIGDGDSIGIVLDTQVIFWTTVDGAPGGLTAALASPLPSAASAGNMVVNYPAGTDITRPLKVPRAASYRYNIGSPAGPNEVPMWRKARQQYMDLPSKQTPGAPIEFYYAPKMVSGEFFVWNPINIQNWGVRFTWYRSLADFLTTSNTMDLPQEWANTLMWNMAREMMVGIEVPPARAQLIASSAASRLDLLSGWDKDSEDVQVGMNFQHQRR